MANRTDAPAKAHAVPPGGVQPEFRSASIVLLGSFNPLIFRPDWMVGKGLVSATEVERAVEAKQIDVIHPEVVFFHLPSLTVQVRTQIMIVETSEDPFVRILDLVLGCFAALPETPISKLGINIHSHYQTQNEEHYFTLGDILAPKEPWSLLLGLGESKGKRTGGLRAMTMEQKPRIDGQEGHIQVKVEPSDKIRYGIHVHVNDHYEQTDGAEPSGALKLMTILGDNWETSVTRSVQLSDAVMTIR